MHRAIAALVAAGLFCLAFRIRDWPSFWILALTTLIIPESFFFVVVVLSISSMFNQK